MAPFVINEGTIYDEIPMNATRSLDIPRVRPRRMERIRAVARLMGMRHPPGLRPASAMNGELLNTTFEL
jgi:hypothetical protein